MNPEAIAHIAEAIKSRFEESHAKRIHKHDEDEWVTVFVDFFHDGYTIYAEGEVRLVQTYHAPATHDHPDESEYDYQYRITLAETIDYITDDVTDITDKVVEFFND